MKNKLLVNKNILMIFTLIALCIDGFYLIDTTKGILGLKYDDFIMLLVLAFEFYILIKYRSPLDSTAIFAGEVLFGVAIILVAAFMGSKTYGQPFLMGLRANRIWFVWLLFYFPLAKLLRTQRLYLDQFERMIEIFCVIFLIIATAQYFVGDSFVFTTTRMDFRYGNYRFYFENPILLLFTGIQLNKYVNTNRLRNFIAILWVVFFYVVITKGRMNTIVIVCSLIVFLVFFSKISPGKKIAIYIGVAVAVMYLLGTEMGEQILNILTGQSVDSSIGIREIGREFYISEILKNAIYFLFGHGNMNTQWKAAVTLSRFNEGISIADNGLIGLCYNYGIISIIWFIAIVVKSFRHSYKVFKTTNNCSYMFFIFANTLGTLTLWPSCFEPTFTFAMYAAMLSAASKIGNWRSET